MGDPNPGALKLRTEPTNDERSLSKTSNVEEGIGDPDTCESQNSTLKAFEDFQLDVLLGNGTSPATPLNATQTTPASIGAFMEKLAGFLMPFSQTLNISGADPLTAGFIKSMYYGLGIQAAVIPEELGNHTSLSGLLMGLPTTPRKSTLLSEVSFFRNLTRHAYINQIIITVAEGYVITILVVVSFILIFLIREWVVQQQPGINIGAGFNAEFAGQERPRDQQAPPERAAEQAVIPAHNEVIARAPREPRPMARPRRRNAQQVAEPEHRVHFDEDLHQNGEHSIHRPPTPFEPSLPPEIFEGMGAGHDEPRMTEQFLAIWRRAESNPQEVLRIIEGEGLADEMRYWVKALSLRLEPDRSDKNGLSSPSPSTESLSTGPSTDTPELHAPRNRSPDSLSAQRGSDGSSNSSDSWVNVPQPLSLRAENVLPGTELSSDDKSPVWKGKEKAVTYHQKLTVDPLANTSYDTKNTTDAIGDKNKENLQFLGFPNPLPSASSTSRPRSTSDGPEPRERISPLGHNNWSFSNLPQDGSSKVEVEKSHKIELTPNADTEFTPLQLQSHNEEWKPHSRQQRAIAEDQDMKPPFKYTTPPADAPKDDFDSEAPVRITQHDGTIIAVRSSREFFDGPPGEYQAEGLVDESNEERIEGPEINPFAPDTPLPEPRAPIAQAADNQDFIGRVADWLWGGAGNQRPEEQVANDEHIVEDLADEAPFVPVAHHDAPEAAEDGNQEQDPEVLEAAIAAGLDPNDPDALDDAEDFDGVMELVGMRGPLFGLVQNALFSAFLLALTVAFGIWIPYNIGRISLFLVVNLGPAFKVSLKLVFGFAAFLQDMALAVLGLTSYSIIAVISLPLKLWPSPSTATNFSIASRALGLGYDALQISTASWNRIQDGSLNGIIDIMESDAYAFSAVSHEALMIVKSRISDVLSTICNIIVFIFVGDLNLTISNIWTASIGLLTAGCQLIAGMPLLLTRPDSWVISLETAKRTTPLDLELGSWGGMDRFWATLAGYSTLSLLGMMYVRKGSPFSTGQAGREWEATIIDLLHQAGGVMKVILIISIEMLVFPLYCGLLLDAALLPLFDKATVMSRILFTLKSPFTSIFVHWFVGTCYMFHFALFVSMCRKIMRKGVLYFIRDPDDPTFHPVRDVLERNLATQLRKILFSALIYGALVVICLGGVVWGLAFAFGGVLPIHWSSNEPVLEFPIDLLFYNFLMPLAVKFFKPSDGLHAMYSWWFRQCARQLRLTWFLFDERQLDEEGYHVRKTWKDVFYGVKGDPFYATGAGDPPPEATEVIKTRHTYFQRDGRYVRAPASDQVRIPKGNNIFLTVDQYNKRLDGISDSADGIHGRDSNLYKLVYIPPSFRLRICLFILFIWLFAAFTGVSITIVPLVFGRYIFAKMIPSDVRKNDIYAFSIGIYILGSALYAAIHLRQSIEYIRASLATNAEMPQNVLRRLSTITYRVTSITWTYAAFIFILPTLFAFLVEFYFLIPLHTYFFPDELHVVHFVQSWTLGLLYVKLTTRLIIWHEDSRPARALRAITQNGYLNPDARLATRSFILPAGLVISTALFIPWWLARVATMTVFLNTPEKHVFIYRYAYPMVLCLGLHGIAMWALVGVVRSWKQKIKDEVYLIGERLHNFGERKAGNNGIHNVRRIDT
ncbi:hypothetical protein B7494_g4089 [Chlorociboria aeruginascens]|nr:hypothetical protein B7494_g4089 [Chlorociboria aeruginascens]